MTVHFRNHLNRLKHMSPDNSLDFHIRHHRPYTSMHPWPCREAGLLDLREQIRVHADFLQRQAAVRAVLQPQKEPRFRKTSILADIPERL